LKKVLKDFNSVKGTASAVLQNVRFRYGL